MQPECSEAGCVPEGLPGEGGQKIPIQSQLMEEREVCEAPWMDDGDGVVGKPEIYEVWQG